MTEFKPRLRLFDRVALKLGYVPQHLLITCLENLKREAIESTKLRRQLFEAKQMLESNPDIG